MKILLLKVLRACLIIIAGVFLFIPVIIPGALLLSAMRLKCQIRGWHRTLATQICEDCNKVLEKKELDLAIAKTKEEIDNLLRKQTTLLESLKMMPLINQTLTKKSELLH